MTSCWRGQTSRVQLRPGERFNAQRAFDRGCRRLGRAPNAPPLRSRVRKPLPCRGREYPMLNPVARRKPNRLRRPRVQFDHRLNRDARREEIIRHRLLPRTQNRDRAPARRLYPPQPPREFITRIENTIAFLLASAALAAGRARASQKRRTPPPKSSDPKLLTTKPMPLSRRLQAHRRSGRRHHGRQRLNTIAPARHEAIVARPPGHELVVSPPRPVLRPRPCDRSPLLTEDERSRRPRS
jgi:hypothetical protein